MKKIVLLGRGGSGKSTVARKFGEVLNIPVIELDRHFWQPGLIPLSKNEWISKQKKLTGNDSWIMDGDLGKYDVLSERLKFADTIIILDFPLWACFFRALRRSRERIDFWWWLFTWRLLELPKIIKIVKEYAPTSRLIMLKNQKELDGFIREIKNN
jgi:adenylate kinase family enzyme